MALGVGFEPPSILLSKAPSKFNLFNILRRPSHGTTPIAVRWPSSSVTTKCGTPVRASFLAVSSRTSSVSTDKTTALAPGGIGVSVDSFVA